MGDVGMFVIDVIDLMYCRCRLSYNGITVQAVIGDGAVLCKGVLLRFYLEFTLRFAGRLISSRSGHFIIDFSR